MVIYTTKLLIDGLSLKIQYFSRTFRMSWSSFLTLSITVNLRFCTPQFLKCLTEGMFFVPPLISLRCCVPPGVLFRLRTDHYILHIRLNKLRCWSCMWCVVVM